MPTARKPWCASLVIAATTVTACAPTVVAGHATVDRASQPLNTGPTLTADQLGGLLLGPAAIDTIMGTTMGPLTDYDTMPGHDGATVSDPSCIGMVFNTTDYMYPAGSYVAVRGRHVEKDRVHKVDEGVVSFTDPTAAQHFWDSTQQAWDRCAGVGQLYTPAGDSDPERWTPRPRTQVADVMAAVSDLEGGDGYACQHAMTITGNTLADVTACAPKIDDQAVAIVDAITAKFPA